jgi:hypothetical protein
MHAGSTEPNHRTPLWPSRLHPLAHRPVSFSGRAAGCFSARFSPLNSLANFAHVCDGMGVPLVAYARCRYVTLAIALSSCPLHSAGTTCGSRTCVKTRTPRHHAAYETFFDPHLGFFVRGLNCGPSSASIISFTGISSASSPGQL